MSNELLTDPVKGLIDYAFVRAAQLLGGVLLTAALLAVIVLRLGGLHIRRKE
ncbi:MAG: hypothetical protein GY906_33280 [bacterium]|nr:hypothetical protein [bacterium]